MIRLLHAADLHLSVAEREYGLAVFAELLDLARRERADFILFCGDLFDTFPDAEALRAEVRDLLARARDVGGPGGGAPEFLFLPGNHEALRRGAGELSRLDFGPASLLEAPPFQWFRRGREAAAVEFLAIPHQDDYAGYGQWAVPAKAAPWRIALAHGIVAGMAYRGPDAEGGGTALDPDLFARFQVDYAALGHIHGRRHQAIGPVTFAYPGSSRVWRRHESGPRGANLLELPATPASRPLEPRFRPLLAAGEYRHYALGLSLDGEPPDLDRLATAWGPQDSVELEFTGLVEDENAVARLAEEVQSRYARRVRALEINRDGVSALAGISSNPVARRFLESWQARPEARDLQHPRREAWLKARDLALLHLKQTLERAA